jgi:hypothetical protein
MADDLKGLSVSIGDLDRTEMVRTLLAASDRCEETMELSRSKQARLKAGSEKELAMRQHQDAFFKMERLNLVMRPMLPHAPPIRGFR